ncbi:MAG: transposase [Acidobacteriota bacterium]|nr:transposase [Acidobacteriota bacterium]
MKRSRKSVRRKAAVIPILRFEDQSLTSCSGLVVFQALFARLGLNERLGRCLRSSSSGIYGLGVMIRLLVVHLLLGYRELRDYRFYEDDVLVKRLLGLNRLPDVSTISRELSRATQKEADKLRRLVCELVLDRLEVLAPARLTPQLQKLGSGFSGNDC